MLLDVGNSLRHKYGVDGRAMVLIRPDGYLALRHDDWAPEQLKTRLQRWLEATASTLSEES